MLSLKVLLCRADQTYDTRMIEHEAKRAVRCAMSGGVLSVENATVKHASRTSQQAGQNAHELSQQKARGALLCATSRCAKAQVL